jgi:hypothetical protein
MFIVLTLTPQRALAPNRSSEKPTPPGNRRRMIRAGFVGSALSPRIEMRFCAVPALNPLLKHVINSHREHGLMRGDERRRL